MSEAMTKSAGKRPSPERPVPLPPGSLPPGWRRGLNLLAVLLAVSAALVYFTYAPRLDTFRAGFEWLEGATGRALVLKGPGVLAARIDPATGRIVDVRDSLSEPAHLTAYWRETPPGTAVAVLYMGNGDEKTAASWAPAFRELGETKPLPVPWGAGYALVVPRGSDGPREAVNPNGPLRVTFPMDGPRARALPIYVRDLPYQGK